MALNAAPPESLRDLRRGQIVREARALVADGGLQALTIGALEARCAFSRGVITYHFKNKDEIVQAVLQSAVDEIDAAIYDEAQAHLDPRDQLRAVLLAVTRGFLGHREAGHILMSFWGRLQADPGARELNAALFAGYRKASRALVETGQQQGIFRADADPDAVAAVMVGSVIGIATQVYFEPGAVHPDAACEAAARGVLAGLAP